MWRMDSTTDDNKPEPAISERTVQQFHPTRCGTQLGAANRQE